MSGIELCTNSSGDLCLTEQTTTTEPFDLLLSESDLFFFRLINWTILCGIFNLFGIFSNTANMAVFAKSGFKDSINISLFVLAMSDFGACITIVWVPFFGHPWMKPRELSYVADDVIYIIGAWPHVGFTKITTLITAFITFERCLCVAMPLKVKTIVTRKRVIGYLVFVYTIITIAIASIYFGSNLGWSYYPKYNISAFGLVYSDKKAAIDNVVMPFLNMGVSLGGFVAIIICTIILITTLREKAKWRKSATTATAKSDHSTKEMKISKMVAIISSLFIVSFLPTVAMQMTFWINPRTGMQGDNENVTKAFASFTFVMESINSAVNVFVYYKNSSNYRAVFKQMFCFKKALRV